MIRNFLKKNSMTRKAFVAMTEMAVGLMTLLLLISSYGCNGKEVSALSEIPLVIDHFEEMLVTEIIVGTEVSFEEIALPQTLTGYVVVSTVEEDLDETPTDETEQSNPSEPVLQQMDIPVIWVCEEYTPATAGVFVFTVELNEEYAFEGDLPQMTVIVQASAGEDTALEESFPTEDSDPDAQQTPDPSIVLEPTATPEPLETPEGIVLETLETEPTVSPESSHIIVFLNDPINIEVVRGTAIEEIPLPATLPALNALNEQIEVPVTWTNIIDELSFSLNDYTRDSLFCYGPWTFTAVVDPTKYLYEGDSVTASVYIADCNVIERFCGVSSGGLIVRFVAFAGDSVRLPSELTARMTDGGYKNIPVSWKGSYDKDSFGTYTYTMQIDGEFVGGGSLMAEIVIILDND